MTDSSEETDKSVESVAGLVKGREKRITAGNRLQALLDQEFEPEPIFDTEYDHDEDFESDKHSLYDIEISESDHEETATSSEGSEEYDIEKTEKKIKKKAQEPFFKLRIQKEHKQPEKSVQKFRSKSITMIQPEFIRHSLRTHTIENKNLIDRKLKEAQKRKEKLGSSVKIRERPMTQEERIAEAKITEEKNKKLLQRLIKMEEEKKNIKHLLKTNKPMTEPFIRFWSRGIEQSSDGKLIFPNLKSTNSNEENKFNVDTHNENAEDIIEQVNDTKCLIDTSKNISEFLPEERIEEATNIFVEDNKMDDVEKKIVKTMHCQSNNSISTSIDIDDKQPENSINSEDAGPLQGPSMLSLRNYIMLEGFPEPFDLNKQKNILFSSTSLPIRKTAKYKDPVSGLYYSDLASYQTIHKIISGNIPWSRLVGTFVDVLKPANGVPFGFHDSILSSQ